MHIGTQWKCAYNVENVSMWRSWHRRPYTVCVQWIFSKMALGWCGGDEFGRLIPMPKSFQRVYPLEWDGVFQTGYIPLWRALEGSFQTEVLKTSHFKGPFGMKDFEGYNWWALRAPMILCAESLHDDGASVWARDDDAEGQFQNHKDRA